MTTIYERIYAKLERLVGDLSAIPETRKSKVSGFMDLNLNRLSSESGATVIALSHCYKRPSGDTIPDPDMKIRVMPSEKMAEALSYQDSYTYNTVYGDNGRVVSPAMKQELNEFLEQWLSNCLQQGHRLS